MSPRRILGVVAALASLATVAVSTTDAAASPSSPSAASLTFDWPLECPATVTQRYYDPVLAVDVTYDVEATEAVGLSGVVAVEFGTAEVDSAVGDPNIAELEPQLGAFFTNPVIEVEADGSPVEAVGFEEWWEGFEDTAEMIGGDEADLEREISHRAAAVTWETWVGLWSTLPPLDGDVVDLSDVPYVDENLESHIASLEVVVTPGDGGATTFVAERSADGAVLEELLRDGIDPATDRPVSYEPDLGQRRVTSMTLTADPATLVPAEASYEVRFLDDTGTDDLVVAYEWSFDWPECDGGRTTGDIDAAEAATDVVVPPGFDAITVDELPPEARETLALIEAGGPFPYRQDGAVFENREGILPDEPYGYYHEYTVETPGSDDRGARRLVTGERGELYFTADHYDSFVVVIE